jgi:hypothetical protein
MKLVLVASLCHTLQGIPAPVCHEQVVIDTSDGGPQLCAFGQAVIADWKNQSPRFKSEEWTVAGYKCVFGSYTPKDAL